MIRVKGEEDTPSSTTGSLFWRYSVGVEHMKDKVECLRYLLLYFVTISELGNRLFIYALFHDLVTILFFGTHLARLRFSSYLEIHPFGKTEEIDSTESIWTSCFCNVELPEYDLLMEINHPNEIHSW